MDCLVRTTPQLAAVCAKAREGGFVSLDTEFVWKRTYRPILGIVQLAGADGDCRALDCLTGVNPGPLGELVADPGTVKILHDARQDLEHLRHYTGAAPRNIFDTQLAAAFAGFPSGMGLQKLLFEAIGVGLPKTETLTDWSCRPLSAAQVEYALDDVRFLARLRDELVKRAEARGTLAWLEEDLLRYDDPAIGEDPQPGEMWKKVKCGRARLDGRARAALQELAATREICAREWNLPRSWLTDDASLVQLCLAPAPSGRLRFRHRLPNDGLRMTLAGEYAAALDRAAALPEDELPDEAHPRYIKEVEEAADAALAWMRTSAERLGIDPVAIASRATVIAFVDNVYDQANPLARGWRLEAVGREMAERFGVD